MIWVIVVALGTRNFTDLCRLLLARNTTQVCLASLEIQQLEFHICNNLQQLFLSRIKSNWICTPQYAFRP